jgi:tetratricopeptide (TPR) repeat protein
MRAPLALVLIALSLAAPARAESEDDRACQYERGELRIAACTRIIDNPDASPADRARAYENRGSAISSNGSSGYPEAAADYDRAIQLEPTTQRYGSRGLMYAFTDRYDEAIADFDRVIAAKPDNAFFLRIRGDTYFKMGNAERGLSDYSQAISVAPDDVDAYLARGEAYFAREEYAKSILDFDHAIALKSERHSHLMRGRAYAKLGDREKAIADFTRVIAFDPNWTTGYSYRVDVYEEAGDIDAAVADIDKLIALNPNDDSYPKRRAHLIETRELAARTPPATPAVAPPAAPAAPASEPAREATSKKAVEPKRAETPAETGECRRYMPGVNLVVPVPCRE